jgi:hypothetical protein
MKIIDTNFTPPGKRFFRRIFDRLFAYEAMSGNGVCPVYLERWILGEAFNCGAYLHHFIGDDWALDPHDHPRRFISIGVKGWYWEDIFYPDGTLKQTFKYKAPWIRSFPAEHLHRVRASECGNCWTIVIVLPKSRRWGVRRFPFW